MNSANVYRAATGRRSVIKDSWLWELSVGKLLLDDLDTPLFLYRDHPKCKTLRWKIQYYVISPVFCILQFLTELPIYMAWPIVRYKKEMPQSCDNFRLINSRKKMKTFSVYKHPTLGYEAVKQGFGWPAFFFSVIWAFLSKMWGHGFAFVGVFLLLNLFEAEYEKLGHEYVVLGMSLANFAFCIIIGMLGNEWRQENLIKRGFKKLSSFEAETKDAAIAMVETISSDPEKQQEASTKQEIRTYYDDLQVSENASIEFIRWAYKTLSRKWHPDKYTNDDEKKNAARIMRIINEAYSVLSDPEQRKEHDAWISEQSRRYGESSSDETGKFSRRAREGCKKNKVKVESKGFFRQENPIVHILFVTLMLLLVYITVSTEQIATDSGTYKSNQDHKPLPEVNDSVTAFKLRAELGDAVAQYNLGIMYRYGQGVTQDYKQAAKWYQLAAEQGLVEAQYNLGTMYDNGQGVAQDYKQALKWYQLAAEQGYTKARYNLGVMYHEGQSVAQDYKQALKWYQLAAEQGYTKAWYSIGVMYKDGEGVTQDYKMAHMYYNISAAKGYGPGVEKRDEIAQKMTPKQIVEAQQMAREWLAKH